MLGADDDVMSPDSGAAALDAVLQEEEEAGGAENEFSLLSPDSGAKLEATVQAMTPQPPPTGINRRMFKRSPHPYKGDADFDYIVKKHYDTIFPQLE